MDQVFPNTTSRIAQMLHREQKEPGVTLVTKSPSTTEKEPGVTLMTKSPSTTEQEPGITLITKSSSTTEQEPGDILMTKSPSTTGQESGVTLMTKSLSTTGKELSPPEQQCFENFKYYIETEKTELDKFYDDDALSAKAKRGADMITQLLEDGCYKEAARDLTLLTLYDIVMLIDDSSSMRVDEVVKGKALRIETLKTTLKEITKIYDLANPDGILSVRYLNTSKGRRNVNSEKAKTLLDKHIYNGLTMIGTELKKKVLNRFVWDPTNPMKKPLLVMIITDGTVEGERRDRLQEVIKECTKALKKDTKLGKHAVAFHFSRVGNDNGAKELLESLDNHQEFGDYVDCLPATTRLEELSDPVRKWNVLPKLLLGAISEYWDVRDTFDPFEPGNGTPDSLDEPGKGGESESDEE